MQKCDDDYDDGGGSDDGGGDDGGSDDGGGDDGGGDDDGGDYDDDRQCLFLPLRHFHDQQKPEHHVKNTEMSQLNWHHAVQLFVITLSPWIMIKNPRNLPMGFLQAFSFFDMTASHWLRGFSQSKLKRLRWETGRAKLNSKLKLEASKQAPVHHD